MPASHEPTTDAEPSVIAKPKTRRANNVGGVYKTPSGRVRGAITLPGSPKRHWVSGRTAKEVQAELNRLRDAGGASSTEKVEKYLTSWLDANRNRKNGIKAATWRAYETIVRLYLIPELGHIRLDRLTASDVERMTDALTSPSRQPRPLSPRSAWHARAVLRAALRKAVRDGLLRRNVASDADAPKLEDHAPAFLDPGQLRTLLDAVADDPLGPLVTLAAMTGMRQGETLGLCWADVDLDAARLTIRQQLGRAWLPDGTYGFDLVPPKTAKSKRTISLPARSVDALRRQRVRQAEARLAAGTSWQGGDLIFSNAVGRPLVGADVNAAFQRMLRSAGLPHIAWHGLRHSAATTLLTSGIPLQTVAAQLGHTSIALVASTYGHVLPDDLRTASRAMDRALG